jgi:chromodomain-helicase-DNA-binding protein 4
MQVDGLNWLCNNWWNLQPCILADEMGLGKTVQIATFIGTIVGKWNAYPCLVVVPNSTVSNWIREFERWAPKIRVVPFYGESRARECIARYELETFHVLVTTYESVTNPKDFNAVFKKRPRWEALVIDEGQRCMWHVVP